MKEGYIMTDKSSEKEQLFVIDIGGMMKAVFKRFYIIILVASLLGIGAFCKSYFLTVPMYISTAKVYTINADSTSEANVYNNIMMSSELINDYEEIIKSRYVMEKVLKEMKIDMTAEALKASVSVNAIEDTRILEISVSDTDPLVARDLTNKVCEVAGERIVDVMNIEAINVIDEARIPESAYNNNVIGDAIKGFIGGGFISTAIIVLLFMLDTTIKSQDDITNMTGLTVLGVIPYDEKNDKNGKYNSDKGLKGFLLKRKENKRNKRR